MITEEEILYNLDNGRNGCYPIFVELGHPHVFPIDSRINLFRNNNNKWAIAIEVLGYNPRSEPIALEITYYGNCLTNLDTNAEQVSNQYYIFPIDEESYDAAFDFEELKPEASHLMVRGEMLKISHSKKDYEDAGIKLKEIEENAISPEEVGRLLIIEHSELFRATDNELYKSIPTDLKKVMVIDEWHHRDYYQDQTDYNELLSSLPSIDQLSEAFDTNKDKINLSKEDFLGAFDFSKHNANRLMANKIEKELNSPGSYETWQMIAKVLATGDTSFYRPTLKPNSHWSNWPNAGYT